MPWVDEYFEVPLIHGSGSTLHFIGEPEPEKVKPIGFVLPETRKRSVEAQILEILLK